MDPDVDREPPPISDEELTALALAADPDQPLGADAVPLPSSSAAMATGLLPEWYMPAPRSMGGGPLRRWLIGGLVVALLSVSGAGLCVTYGLPEIAW